MQNSFQAVIANLNTSLRNPVDRGDGEQPHCYVRADELAALIQCAMACYHPGCVNLFTQADGVKAIEACDHE
jgi:hypothetical protein